MFRTVAIFALILLQAAPIALPGTRACIAADGCIAIEADTEPCRCAGGHDHDHDAPPADSCCHDHDSACDGNSLPAQVHEPAAPCECAHVALVDGTAVAARAKSLKAADDGFTLIALVPSPALVTPLVQIETAVHFCDPSLGASPSLVTLCALLRC